MRDCPFCGSDNWEYYPTDAERTTPATGHCPDCGFSYEEHCQHPLDEQVARYFSRFISMVKDQAPHIAELEEKLEEAQARITELEMQLDPRERTRYCPQCELRQRKIDELEKEFKVVKEELNDLSAIDENNIIEGGFVIGVTRHYRYGNADPMIFINHLRRLLNRIIPPAEMEK